MSNVNIIPATTTSTQQSHLVLIDGYGFVFRAYHSLPPLTRSDGTPIGAVLGFTNMLLKIVDDIDADHIAVILDAGEKTFRNEIYSDYKANRPPAPDDLIPQFKLVKEAAEALNLPVVDKVGFEADDIIATYAKQAQEQNYKVTIISSDKDLMQLVDSDISMYDAMKNKHIDNDAVKEKFGVEPNKVLDVLSLMGDSSDNVPGVSGIGPKTAATLINEYGTLEHLLENAGSIKQNKRRQTLLEQKDLALLSKKLITLNTQVTEIPAVEELRVREKDAERLVAFLKHNEFKSTLTRIEKSYGIPSNSDSLQPPKAKTVFEKEIVDSIARLEEITISLKNAPYISLDFLVIDDSLCGISIGSSNTTYYIPLESKNEIQSDLLSEESNNNSYQKFDTKLIVSHLKLCFSNPSCMKIIHDNKRLLHILSDYNITMKPYDDIMSMSYVVDAAKHQHSLNEICDTYSPDHTPQEIEQLIGKGKKSLSINDLPLDRASDYSCKRAFALYQLSTILKQKMLNEHLITLYERLDKPLSTILAEMEQYGVLIDAKNLNKLSYEFAGKLSLYEKEIFHHAGTEFNISSPKQLGEVLFDNLGLTIDGKPPKKSKTGAYSTNADILEKLSAEGQTIADHILLWRGLSKLKSTYTDSLIKQISEKDGRVHTNFKMTSTTTGRLSSTDPNLQNIPVRTEEGYKIREAFKAASGYKLISADYSQIELRILAHMANIETLKTAFKEGKDIHAITASQIFGIALSEMDPITRRKAKAINFGIIYGISAFGLAKQLSIPRQDAANYIEAYFKQYPGIRHYMEEIKDFARSKGYVETLFKRRCYLKDINSKNAMLRNFSERAAINAPLQGTAADVIKYAMIKLDKVLTQHHPDARMILQVHDELLIEAPEQNAQQIAELTKEVMISASPIQLDLEVEVGIGTNWKEIH